jgi:hypothetical protein
MKTPLTRRSRRSKKTLQMTFTFPTAAAAPQPPTRDAPFAEIADAQNSSSGCVPDEEAAASWDFDPGRPTNVITRDCPPHLPNSQKFSAMTDDPQPTGSGS